MINHRRQAFAKSHSRDLGQQLRYTKYIIIYNSRSSWDWVPSFLHRFLTSTLLEVYKVHLFFRDWIEKDHLFQKDRFQDHRVTVFPSESYQSVYISPV